MSNSSQCVPTNGNKQSVQCPGGSFYSLQRKTCVTSAGATVTPTTASSSLDFTTYFLNAEAHLRFHSFICSAPCLACGLAERSIASQMFIPEIQTPLLAFAGVGGTQCCDERESLRVHSAAAARTRAGRCDRHLPRGHLADVSADCVR